MMVLASIYLAVSASLPTTALIKPVEWWLLVNLAYPGLVITLNILLQVRWDRIPEEILNILSDPWHMR